MSYGQTPSYRYPAGTEGAFIFDSDKDPDNIQIGVKIANDASLKSMIGINESGYVFWDNVYQTWISTIPPTMVNTDVANSFSSTFSNIRVFHNMQFDYKDVSVQYAPNNHAPILCGGIQDSHNKKGMCLVKDIYKALDYDYSFVCGALETWNHDFPAKGFSSAEWGGNVGSIKTNAKIYASEFLAINDPSKDDTRLVDRLYASNELWGWTDIEGYKAMCDGFIEAFDKYYGVFNWNIDLWLGAFQAYKESGVWEQDYVGTMISDEGKNKLGGLDVHPYSFNISELPNGVYDPSEHPESGNSFFKTLKNMVQWRDVNAPNLGLSATEFGWNSDDVIDWGTKTANNGAETYQLALNPDGTFSTTNDPSSWKILVDGVGEEAQAVYTTRAYLLFARYGYESAYIYSTVDNNEPWFRSCGTYRTEMQTTPKVVDGATYYRLDFGGSAFLDEKLVMPSMRKLGNNQILGNKKYLEVLQENNNGVYAMLFGDDADHPTHLVAWYARDIKKMDEAQINAQVLTETLANIGLPANLSIATNQGFTRLDWHEDQINNIPVGDVYNASTGALTLTPIPVVIPLEASSVACDVTIPVVRNRCISLYADVGEKITTNSDINYTDITALSDGLDGTNYPTKLKAAGDLWFKIPITEPSTNQLILHWRPFSDENRNNPQRSLQDYTIESSVDGVNWVHIGDYTNSMRDNYIIFDIDPNNKPKYIKVTEHQNWSDLVLVRLDIYEKAPTGERDDIWLFIGNSITKADITPWVNGNFADGIRSSFDCQYPIIINGGYGGEKATEMDDDNFVNHGDNLTKILSTHPEITFVPICYGLNDIMLSGAGNDGLRRMEMSLLLQRLFLMLFAL